MIDTVDESGQRKVVENVVEKFPNRRRAVFFLAFLVETVHAADLTGIAREIPGFVVASQKVNGLRVLDFEVHQ